MKHRRSFKWMMVQQSVSTQENEIVLIKGVAFRYFVNDRLVDRLDEVVGEWNRVGGILLEDVDIEAMLKGKKKLQSAKRRPRRPSWKTQNLRYYL